MRCHTLVAALARDDGGHGGGCGRMVRAGVRFGIVDEIVYDYYPSTLWEDAEG